MLTTALVYAQIIAGATMRHTGAGLAIPDFPLVFGSVVPPYWTPSIAIHYAHRVGALVVSGCVLATVGHVLYHHVGRLELRRPSLLLLALLAIQITLGGLTVLSGKHYIINSLHVVTGAFVLGASLVLTLRTCRPRFAVGAADATGPNVTGADGVSETGRDYESSGKWNPTPGVPGARV
jgi:cytochrome c oxidase assembly protein subunit 15